MTLWPDAAQIGNYLSDYFRGVAQSIATGQTFHNGRRTLNHTFYSRCLPASLDLSALPRVKPRGQWDWMVYTRQTQLFWRSMQPLVHQVVGDALTRCGLLPVVEDPVLHFRCASTPINRKSVYHFQRYGFYRAALRQYERVHGAPLRALHLIACVVDEHDEAQQQHVCGRYLADLRTFLEQECGVAVRVHNCRRSMFHDFAVMVAAPFLISSGSTMSLMAAAAGEGGLNRRRFAFPPAFNEEACAANSRATHQGGTGCRGCGAWMLSGEDHALSHCEVTDYTDTDAVTALLRAPSPLPTAAGGGGPCTRCQAVHCDHFVLSSCLIRHTRPEEAAAPRKPRALRGVSCAGAGARLMSQRECKVLARASMWGDSRRWIGASTNPSEHPGCLLWDDGGVEFNGHQDQSKGCNVKGVCLCMARGASGAAGGAAVVEVLGAGLASSSSRFEQTTTIVEPAEDVPEEAVIKRKGSLLHRGRDGRRGHR